MRAVEARRHAHATRCRKRSAALSTRLRRPIVRWRGGFAARSGGRVSPVVVVRGVSVTATAVSYGSFKWCCVWCRLIARCIGINAYDRISTYVCRFVVAYLSRVHARAFSLSLSRSLVLFTSLAASLLPPTRIPPSSLFRSPIFGSVEVRAGTPRSIS